MCTSSIAYRDFRTAEEKSVQNRALTAGIGGYMNKKIGRKILKLGLSSHFFIRWGSVYFDFLMRNMLPGRFLTFLAATLEEVGTFS